MTCDLADALGVTVAFFGFSGVKVNVGLDSVSGVGVGLDVGVGVGVNIGVSVTVGDGVDSDSPDSEIVQVGRTTVSVAT